MFTVYLNCWITRRKTFHLICDDDLHVLTRCARMDDAIDWLSNEGAQEYRLVSRDRAIVVKVVSDETREGPKAWRKLQPPYYRLGQTAL